MRIAAVIKFLPLRELGPLVRDPGRCPALDRGIVAVHEMISGWGADRGAGDIADDFERCTKLLDLVEVAGHDRIELGRDVVNFLAEVLRLRSAGRPTPGRGTMKFEGATNAAIRAAPSLHRRKFVGG